MMQLLIAVIMIVVWCGVGFGIFVYEAKKLPIGRFEWNGVTIFCGLMISLGGPVNCLLLPLVWGFCMRD